METQKIVNLLNSSRNEYSKLATKFITKSIESSLCDYSDVYILVIGNIAVTRTIAPAGNDLVKRKQPLNAVTQVVFKNCELF